MQVDTHALALLLLRLGFAYFFLGAARAHTFKPRGWEAALHFTSVLLKENQVGAYSTRVRYVAVLSQVTLWLGGLGVLAGLLTEASAAALLLFAGCGYVIHMRETHLAQSAAGRLAAMVPEAARPAIGPLLESAWSGNIGAGVKNIVIMAAAALLILEGPGAYSMSALLARVTGP